MTQTIAKEKAQKESEKNNKKPKKKGIIKKSIEGVLTGIGNTVNKQKLINEISGGSLGPPEVLSFVKDQYNVDSIKDLKSDQVNAFRNDYRRAMKAYDENPEYFAEGLKDGGMVRKKRSSTMRKASKSVPVSRNRVQVAGKLAKRGYGKVIKK